MQCEQLSLLSTPTAQLFEDDCLNVMRGMADNRIDFCVTDPPYALTGKSGKGGFMGKEWDSSIPGVDIWKEVLRICKPGSMLAAFGAPRTHHHLMAALEESGWILKDVMMWINGQSFPKGLNIGKHVPGFEGYNTNLKSSYEPIILCMKPLEGTYAKNALKWGVAGMNVEKCRVLRNVEDISGWSISGSKQSENNCMSGKNYARNPKPDNQLGRYPSNVILDETSAEMLDQQSGNRPSCKKENIHNYQENLNGNFRKSDWNEKNTYSDSGGASRFFYTAKASTSERNKGLEGMPLKEQACYGEMKGTENHAPNRSNKVQNNHPCVKPLSLMRYIIRLLAPPGNPTCLDCFAGSGTTLLACKELGIDCIGIEKEPEYCEIIRKRVNIV